MAMSAEDALCQNLKDEYEEQCYHSNLVEGFDSMSPDVIRSALGVARLLRLHLAQCVAACGENQLCDCLHMCSKARRYANRCWIKRRSYFMECPDGDDAKRIADRFDTLLYKELRVEYDRELLGLSQGILETSPPEAILKRANYILRSLEGDHIPAVKHFLGTVVKKPRRDLGLEPDQAYFLASACRFDRTVYAKVYKLLLFLSSNEELKPFSKDAKHSQVSLKFEFLVKTLHELSSDPLVWSFIRLPSSTEILIQILLGPTLLSTSKNGQVKFERTKIVDTLRYALKYVYLINGFAERADTKEIAATYIRRRPPGESDAGSVVGLLPTWFVELITRGTRGKYFFPFLSSVSNVHDHPPAVAKLLKAYEEHMCMDIPDAAFEYNLVPEMEKLVSEEKQVARGNTMFELRTDDLVRRKLLRGSCETTPAGLVIRTDDNFDKTTWTKVFLPINETLLGETIRRGNASRDGDGRFNDDIHRFFQESVQDDKLRLILRRGVLFGKPLGGPESNPVVVDLEYAETYESTHTWTSVGNVEWVQF